MLYTNQILILGGYITTQFITEHFKKACIMLYNQPQLFTGVLNNLVFQYQNICTMTFVLGIILKRYHHIGMGDMIPKVSLPVIWYNSA